jgi:hypothetical protein
MLIFRSVASAGELKSLFFCERFRWGKSMVQFPPPPLTRPPQGGSKQKDPLAHPSGFLHLGAEIRGFFASPNSERLSTTGRARHPSPPQEAQIGVKGSNPRDSP